MQMRKKPKHLNSVNFEKKISLDILFITPNLYGSIGLGKGRFYYSPLVDILDIKNQKLS